MIQRIQSVFLLLVAGLSAALFFTPIFSMRFSGAAAAEVPYTIQSGVFASLTVVISAAIALVAIFLYRTRQRQMMVCRLNLLFIIASIGLILQASDTSALVKAGEQVVIEYHYGVYLPIVQILLTLLAIRFIKKDDDLVRSADRLR